MALNHIDHYLLRAKDIEKSKLFYTEVLGMRVGYRPPFSFFGYWLYLKDKPVVHMVQASTNKIIKSSNNVSAINHIAFNADNFEKTLNYFNKLGIPVEHQIVPEENGAHQLFITDPDGIKIELNFTN